VIWDVTLKKIIIFNFNFYRMVPNCPNSPKTCLYIHPANQDFASYDQRVGIYRPNAFGNGTGQGAFGPRSTGLSSFGSGSMGSMGHGMFGQGTSYQSGAFGSSIFVQNSQRQNIMHGKSTTEQGSSVQSLQKEKKHDIATAETIDTATIATSTIRTISSATTSNNTESSAVSQQAQIQKFTPSPNVPSAVLCKFSENCANPNCMFAHASPASVGTGSILSTLVDIPCKFGSECTQPKCRYSHPSPATGMFLNFYHNHFWFNLIKKKFFS
jgi:hypothetical protein